MHNDGMKDQKTQWTFMPSAWHTKAIHTKTWDF